MKKIFKLLGLIALVAVIGFSVIGCSDDPGDGEPPAAPPSGGNVAVTGVSLNKSTLTLTVNGTETLIATVAPSNAANQAVSWVSDDTDVATVTSSGFVKGIAVGEATITVTTADGNKTAACEVTVKNAVATPTFSIASGAEVVSNTPVNITCITEGAVIYYTIDGSDPKTSLTKESGASPRTTTVSGAVGSTVTIKAYAAKDGMSDSGEASAVYTVKDGIALPVPDPMPGIFNEAQTVSFTPPVGFTFLCTTDGNNPTGLTTPYSSPITVDRTMTIKAQSMRTSDNATSIIAVFDYIIKADTPTISGAGAGTYNEEKTITLTTSGNAEIWYTTDGSAPVRNSGTQYTSAITINKTMTIRAVAGNEGWTPSEELSAAYILKADTPSPSSGAGQYAYTATPTTITLTTSGGATIYYTTDNTPPTTYSTVYSTPIPIDREFILRAKALKTGWMDSEELSAAYTAKVQTPTANEANNASVAWNTTVTLSTVTPGATIYYTLDGSTPTTGSTTTTGSITIHSGFTSFTNKQVTLKAIAVKANCVNSELMQATYTITATLTNVSDVGGYLAGFIANTSENPISFPPSGVGFTLSSYDLGNMTADESGWHNLITAIGTGGKFVNLDLSGCTMTGTEFNPDNFFNYNEGKGKIVSLVLPTVATSLYEYGQFNSFITLKAVTGTNVMTIGGNFAYCRTLTSVSFPVLTTIGDYAFQICTNLTSVSFPLVTTIGKNAFQDTGLTSVTSVSFPLVTTIGDYAFRDNKNLVSVSFDESLVSIGIGVFQDSELTEFILTRSGTPITTLGTNVFDERGYDYELQVYTYSPLPNLSAIKVPSALVNDYKTATNWSAYASKIVAIQ